MKRKIAMLVMLCMGTCNNKPSDIVYQELLDQYNYSTSGEGGLEITNSQKVSQTFTTGIAGILSKIRLYNVRHHRGIPQHDLNVRILRYTRENAIDTEFMLSSFNPNSVPSNNDSVKFIEINIEGKNIQTAAGEILGMELSCLCEGGGATYAWGGELGGYSDGTCLINDSPNLRDMAFESFVKIRK